MIRIVGYQHAYSKDFERLNLNWIEKFFVVEAIDLEVLSDPQKHIIDLGGELFFALNEQEEVLGTVALMKLPDAHYELAKMAVAEHTQGLGIGKLLIQAAIDHVKMQQGRAIELYTNSSLKPALHLYYKFGFKEVALQDNLFARADLKFLLEL